jgi:hypothetical protein
LLVKNGLLPLFINGSRSNRVRFEKVIKTKNKSQSIMMNRQEK